MSTVSEPTEAVSGLNAIGDIKQKMMMLDRYKEQIEEQLMLDEREQVRLVEYKQELDKLQEEKLAHVAELRLIHSDIDVMEGTIKQAETERNRCITQIHSLYAQYVPMLTQVNFLRISLGLPCLQDETLQVKLNNETLNKLKDFEADQRAAGQSAVSLFSSDFQRQLTAGSIQSSQPALTTIESDEPLMQSQNNQNVALPNPNNETIDSHTRWKLQTASSPHSHATGNPFDGADASNSMAMRFSGNAAQSGAKQMQMQVPFSSLPLGSMAQLMQSASASLSDATQSQNPTANANTSQLNAVAFAGAANNNAPLSLQATANLCRMIRQQTPPMKACSSCQQQIHRNAPICPLCKARSRSQHSKRTSGTKRSKHPQ